MLTPRACHPAIPRVEKHGGLILLGIARVLYRLACAILGRDLGIGRSVRALGPFTIRIEAPREIFFDVIAGPYLDRTPRALESKLRVLERRSDDTVLAEHHTQARRIVATTLETVQFRRPARVEFRLVRGPVPHVVERFELRGVEGGTELAYAGELGTDLWALGRRWGATVGDRWEATVRGSFDAIKREAERRAH